MFCIPDQKAIAKATGVYYSASLPLAAIPALIGPSESSPGIGLLMLVAFEIVIQPAMLAAGIWVICQLNKMLCGIAGFRPKNFVRFALFIGAVNFLLEMWRQRGVSQQLAINSMMALIAVAPAIFAVLTLYLVAERTSKLETSP